MPTMNQPSVKVLPMVSRSLIPLEEIRDAMANDPPVREDFKGGWASIENHQSNLRMPGGLPPRSVPELVPEVGSLPRMLQARFYYWDTIPPEQDTATRKLNAIDVMITESRGEHIGLLFSTRTLSYLNRRDGIIASLERILQKKDPSIKVERRNSHLALADEEIFLWLAVQHRDKPQLAPDIRFDEIARISSRDAASRTAELRFGVDFNRPNFLTAVAENETLGPIDIRFAHQVGDRSDAYEIRLHIDGGFEISQTRLHFPDYVDKPNMMLETSLFLAYSMIPRIDGLFSADTDSWNNQRAEVIRNAMTALEQRYQELRTVLESQLREAAQVSA